MDARSEQPESLVVGSIVAGYRLLEQIGAGGMAEVFRASDERLGRQVALKVLAARLAADTAFRARFIRESRAAAAVDHPNIVPIYDAGDAGGSLFIAMRYVPGGDARSLLREGALSAERALTIISPVASALDAAHAHDLIHRDVKPGNMLIDVREGRPDHVYLTDFGISRELLANHLTTTGQFVGTLDYIAPEQIEGRIIDGRADQYSLACTAYELLTGAPPFRRDLGLALINAHLTEPPPRVTDARPDLTAAADAVFARGLAKNFEERYASCQEFADSLRDALGMPSWSAIHREAAPWRTHLPAVSRPEGSDTEFAVPQAPVASGGGTLPAPAPKSQVAPASLAGDYSSLPAWPQNLPPSVPIQAWPTIPPEPVPPDRRRRRARANAGRSAPPPPPIQEAPSTRGIGAPGDKAAAVSIRLKPTFRYVHETWARDDEALPSLGNDDLIEALQTRILHSRGGTFLVTGFRGVGKSTLVQQAIDEIATQGAPAEIFLPVVLSVARSTTTEGLLFAIVRRVFETLNESGMLDQLPPHTRHALILAYMRTSLSYKETQSDGRDRSAGINVGVGSGKAIKSIADIAIPSFSMSASRSQSLAVEAAFLAYSETDAEHDLIRIVSLIGQHQAERPSRPWWRRLLRTRAEVQVPRLHLVVVLDEVDKLTSDEPGMAAVEDLLKGIKNILTMSGAHFVVVAGPDLHDRAVRDAGRGNGVYESVFGWRLYVPCIWDAPDRLLREFVDESVTIQSDVLGLLTRYLRFKARGIPRRLLQEINEIAVRNGNHFTLSVDAVMFERIEFYAYLERVLASYYDGNKQKRLFPVPIDLDRWRLTGYYVADWLLRTEGEPFSALDLLRDDEGPEFDPMLRVSRRDVDRLLDHFAAHGILEVLRDINAMATVMVDLAESNAKVFRLSEQVRRLLYGLAVQHEMERAALDMSPASAAHIQQTGLRSVGGRYEVRDLLRQSGLSSTYKGWDLVTERQVVIKLLRPILRDDPVAIARFGRAAEIAKRLSHSHIAEVYESIEDAENGPVLIKEWIRGTSLDEFIRLEGQMRAGEVAASGYILAETLDYIANAGIVRLDLKPSTITMADRGPVLSDMEIALHEDSASITNAGQFIGTPEFMAPELIDGRAPDRRSDLYSLGLVMYYCVAGNTPWAGLPNRRAIMEAIRNEPVELSGLEISPQFSAAIAGTIARNPEDRFGTGADLCAALAVCPEYPHTDRT